jgi:hypothetical protein
MIVITSDKGRVKVIFGAIISMQPLPGKGFSGILWCRLYPSFVDLPWFDQCQRSFCKALLFHFLFAQKMLAMQPNLVHPAIDITQLKAGHLETFHSCYNSFYHPLHTLATELLIDKSNAVACVQFTFVRCWLNRSRLSSVDYLDAFMRVTVKNTCKFFNNTKSTTDALLFLNRILSPDIRYGRTRSALYAHLQLLSPEMIQSIHPLFESWFINKKTIGEVAVACSMPEDAVQFRIDLACQILHLIISTETFRS